MTVSCGAGTPIADLSAALREVGQRTVLPPGGTVGGALAVGRSGVRRLGDGPMRDALLQARYVGADGVTVQAGGPTVKNVSGFDVCRLLVGSRGTLGFLGEVILRTRPIAQHSQWFTTEVVDPTELFASLHRPTSVLWDGSSAWALLEGHPADVEAQATRASLRASDGPPDLPTHRHLVAPGTQIAVGQTLAAGTFVAELGLGVIHAVPDALPADPPDAAVTTVQARVKQQFDPAGRLNPGVVVG
jgi:glycolate oxidase FAD binding subunit